MMRGKNYGDQNGKNPKANQGTAEGSRKRRAKTVGEPADWGSVNADLLLAAIQAITATGAAIRFGYTRDMGAYAVGFYEDGSSDTEYVPPSEDMDLWLKGVVDDYGK